MGRGGRVNKLNKEIAHIKWQLYSPKANTPWKATARLQAMLDFYQQQLKQIKENPTPHAHSVNIKNINVINDKTKTTPPPKSKVPQYVERCPRDCPGPLDSPHCRSTCLVRQ